MELSVTFNDLFATRIWQSNLADLSPEFPGWMAMVDKMRRAAPATAARSNRLGWMSENKAVLEDKAFKQLREVIRVCCGAALDQMMVEKPEFALESWINIHERGGFNFQHMHDGAMLCGVFYLQAPEGSGALVLRDPRPRSVGGFLKVGAANALVDLHLVPQAGSLVLFPYWLEHHVEPHGSDESRVSISFNVLNRKRTF
jgi:uncharacterized protein (TIGR02466 family)